MNSDQQGAEEAFSGSPQKDRRLMVERLRAQGIRDERVLEVMGRIPRHCFISEQYWDQAYANHPLPIEEGQTISQPYIVALMTETLALKRTDRVLEIGTGSGYQTAILAELAAEVYTIERSRVLLMGTCARLEAAGYPNVHVRLGDGTLGWDEFSPYDVIIATGATPKVPPSLLRQLGEGGRFVLPAGDRQVQRLWLIERHKAELNKRELCYCSFLPLMGKEGWPEEEPTRHH
ncbi:MAG: protein-L-isoaspartate O-methyltransferase [Candidatus Fraserbacteria bacterium RBG_16_55_9]|uniref:Protein-L-isoaspartate O-methyltransferase n=1 Tax=Fraserbacteria sp. (strain RBG_16_55_9) TaxID=1817864 RepID=A0A1F5UWX6_FRAXR|nr:MAG: protein-L-isoaspartate O-methyltransferase [Candidatus Fraserbacteria bacterium RBG_16_55_9]